MAETKINKHYEVVHNIITYPNAITVAAGTIGTYATNVSVNIAKSGYSVIGCELQLVSHPANALVALTGYTNSTATLCIYRTNTVQINIPARDLALAVTYQKA